jgi:hypothetical protein
MIRTTLRDTLEPAHKHTSTQRVANTHGTERQTWVGASWYQLQGKNNNYDLEMCNHAARRLWYSSHGLNCCSRQVQRMQAFLNAKKESSYSALEKRAQVFVCICCEITIICACEITIIKTWKWTDNFQCDCNQLRIPLSHFQTFFGRGQTMSR